LAVLIQFCEKARVKDEGIPKMNVLRMKMEYMLYVLRLVGPDHVSGWYFRL